MATSGSEAAAQPRTSTVYVEDDVLIKVAQRLKAAAYTAGGKDWQKLFREVDKDRSGEIDYKEFYGMCRRVLKLTIPEQDLRRAFLKLDADGSDAVAIDELLELITTVETTSASRVRQRTGRSPVRRIGAGGKNTFGDSVSREDIVLPMQLWNMDCAALASNGELLRVTTKAITEAIAGFVGGIVESKDISVSLVDGSVAAEAVVTPSEVDVKRVQAKLMSCVVTLGHAVSSSVACVTGIKKVAVGSIPPAVSVGAAMVRKPPEGQRAEEAIREGVFNERKANELFTSSRYYMLFRSRLAIYSVQDGNRQGDEPDVVLQLQDIKSTDVSKKEPLGIREGVLTQCKKKGSDPKYCVLSDVSLETYPVEAGKKAGNEPTSVLNVKDIESAEISKEEEQEVLVISAGPGKKAKFSGADLRQWVADVERCRKEFAKSGKPGGDEEEEAQEQLILRTGGEDISLFAADLTGDELRLWQEDIERCIKEPPPAEPADVPEDIPRQKRLSRAAPASPDAKPRPKPTPKSKSQPKADAKANFSPASRTTKHVTQQRSIAERKGDVESTKKTEPKKGGLGKLAGLMKAKEEDRATSPTSSLKNDGESGDGDLPKVGAQKTVRITGDDDGPAHQGQGASRLAKAATKPSGTTSTLASADTRNLDRMKTKEDEAALRIQKITRGNQSRNAQRRVEERKRRDREKAEADEKDAAEHALISSDMRKNHAAIKIQSLQRARTAREELERKKEDDPRDGSATPSKKARGSNMARRSNMPKTGAGKPASGAKAALPSMFEDEEDEETVIKSSANEAATPEAAKEDAASKGAADPKAAKEATAPKTATETAAPQAAKKDAADPKAAEKADAPKTATETAAPQAAKKDAADPKAAEKADAPKTATETAAPKATNKDAADPKAAKEAEAKQAAPEAAANKPATESAADSETAPKDQNEAAVKIQSMQRARESKLDVDRMKADKAAKAAKAGTAPAGTTDAAPKAEAAAPTAETSVAPKVEEEVAVKTEDADGLGAFTLASPFEEYSEKESIFGTMGVSASRSEGRWTFKTQLYKDDGKQEEFLDYLAEQVKTAPYRRPEDAQKFKSYLVGDRSLDSKFKAPFKVFLATLKDIVAKGGGEFTHESHWPLSCWHANYEKLGKLVQEDGGTDAELKTLLTKPIFIHVVDSDSGLVPTTTTGLGVAAWGIKSPGKEGYDEQQKYWSQSSQKGGAHCWRVLAEAKVFKAGGAADDKAVKDVLRSASALYDTVFKQAPEDDLDAT